MQNVQGIRFDLHGDESQGAVILSVESQSQRVATVILAPLLGLALDWSTGNDIGGAFWPLGVVGLSVSLLLFVTAGRRGEGPS